MSQHVFIVMPFGRKEGIDFNQVYEQLIRPALLNVSLEPFRADEEIRPGDIRADMFQELLMADLVIADLSINNPNAWYELGVRHGLRARGIVQIRCNQDKIPFDVCVDRTMHYHLKDGVPDPGFLTQDRAALGQVALETLRLDLRRRPVSPVYLYLPSLQEPDWKSLRAQDTDAFWNNYECWCDRVEIARKNRKPGDILVLADEAPNYALKLEARFKAGKALLSLGQFAYALEQFDQALAINPKHLPSAQNKGIALGRLKRNAEAEQWLKKLSQDYPHDAETWALMARTHKERWVNTWRADNKSVQAMAEDATYESARLQLAIQAYRQGFIEQPRSYFAGINTLTLSHLHRHLQGNEDDDAELRLLEGGVRWAIMAELGKEDLNNPDYWARVSMADLELLVSGSQCIERAYKHAIAAASDDWFALDSSRQQIQLLQDLGFRPEPVSAALAVLDRAIDRLEKPEQSWLPRKVLLFSGHMIDADDRPEPRFPKDKEAVAVDAIRCLLAELDAGQKDLALCGGACGGDLIFAEACLQRQLQVQIHIPFAIPEFLQNSVSFAGDQWQERFHAVINHEHSQLLIMPEELGGLPARVNPYERNNLWQLYSAISWGAEKVHCICLWDGKGGDGPGGTGHMHDSVKQRSGHVYVLDTNSLFG